MATLMITDVPEALLMELRHRAARNGRSVESEAYALLVGSLEPGQDGEADPAGTDRGRTLDEIMTPYRTGGVVDAFLAQRRALWGEG